MNVPPMPPVAVAPAMPQQAAPHNSFPANNTIYINNLNEKIKRDDLKKSLCAVFVQFGKIVDIITAKNLKMRGQAFVVFDEVSAATAALRAMQGFPLFEKPMRIQFARADSDVIAKRKGTFQPRPFHIAIAQGAANNEQLKKELSNETNLSARAIRRRQQRMAVNAGDTNGDTAVPPPPPSQPQAINPAQIPDQPPNKILFVTNLPENCDENMLNMLFQQFLGLREVRMVPGRHDIAFVEFLSETEAAQAKTGLQGFNIQPNKPIRITFAKK